MRRRPPLFALSVLLVFAPGALVAQRGEPPRPQFRLNRPDSTAFVLTLMPRYADSLSYDANGWLLNPTWRLVRPNSVKLCDFVAGRGNPPQRPLLIRKDDCTTQRELLRLNEASVKVGGGIACNQQSIDGVPHGHVNWFPVTLVGRSAHVHLYKGDGDVDFDVVVDSFVAVTAANEHRDEVHAEFRFAETLDRLKDLPGGNTWWHRFATSLNRNRQAAESLANGKPVIVTGLFNLDLVHHWTEVHPVYALMVRVESRPENGRQIDTWAFFVRDRGDEGSCGTFALPYEPPTGDRLVHRTIIPWTPGATGVRLGRGSRAWIHGADAPGAAVQELRAEAEQGVELVVSLPKARRDGSSAMVLGELILEWEIGGDTVTSAWFPPPPPDSAHRGYSVAGEGEAKDTSATKKVLVLPVAEALEVPPLTQAPLTRATAIPHEPVKQWGMRPADANYTHGGARLCSEPGSPAQCRLWTRLEPMVGVGARSGALVTEIRLELFGPGSAVPNAGTVKKLQMLLAGSRIRFGKEWREGEDNWMLGLDYDLVVPFLKTHVFRPYLLGGVELSHPYGASRTGVAGHGGAGILLATGFGVRWRAELRVPRFANRSREYLIVAGTSIRFSKLRSGS
jgi:hypothetical protein